LATSRTQTIIRHVRRAVAFSEARCQSDEQLLRRFVATREEEAFEALVRRHGPMVLGVCRRILGDPHAADDAFQATFLVLATKATSVVPANMLPNWLYGVARQTAVRARSASAKRRLRERQVRELPEPQPARTDPCHDLRPLLDEELACLPSKYRVAVVLCDLESMTHREAAQHLGWPVGTLASRHSRGRRMLRERLARKGLVPASGVAALLSQDGVSACLSPLLISATVRAGSLYATGQAVVGDAIARPVVALTEGVLKAMSFTKIKTVGVVLLLVNMLALGGGFLAHHAAADQPSLAQNQQAAPKAVKEGKKAEAGPLPKALKDGLEIRADGKQVRVRVVLASKELSAVSDRLSYNEGGLLVLEGNVKVQKRQGQEVENIQADKVVINRTTGTINIRGASGIRTVVPALGPVPVALDYGFAILNSVEYQVPFVDSVLRPTAGQLQGKVYQVPFVDSGTVGENQGQPKRPEKKPGDADIPALKKELDELREKVKQLEKRLSDTGAEARDFNLGEFYRRTGHPGSAYFYYELVSRRYPDTTVGDRAKQRLSELRKQIGS
jgi:RNA polymerase sigma factor (sigma-70 family)